MHAQRLNDSATLHFLSIPPTLKVSNHIGLCTLERFPVYTSPTKVIHNYPLLVEWLTYRKLWYCPDSAIDHLLYSGSCTNTLYTCTACWQTTTYRLLFFALSKIQRNVDRVCVHEYSAHPVEVHCFLVHPLTYLNGSVTGTHIIRARGDYSSFNACAQVTRYFAGACKISVIKLNSNPKI